MRLDVYLTEHKHAASRHKAQEMIKRGFVLVNSMVNKKSSFNVRFEDVVSITETLQYVSRAGDKLAFALKTFDVDPSGKECLDIGSSTGGFTDCLLQNDAASVVAVDVGTDQFHASLYGDPRIELHEHTDIRNFKSNNPFDLVVCDVSFISLTQVIPELPRFMKPGSQAILLVKPQFEVASNERTKSGIVKDDVQLETVFTKISECITRTKLQLASDFEAVPIKGADGNQEYVILVEKA